MTDGRRRRRPQRQPRRCRHVDDCDDNLSPSHNSRWKTTLNKQRDDASEKMLLEHFFLFSQ